MGDSHNRGKARLQRAAEGRAAKRAEVQKKRPWLSSLSDFQDKENGVPPHGLWYAEQELLEAVAKGKACELDPWGRQSRIAFIKAAFSQPWVYELAVDIVGANPTRTDELTSRITAGPKILRPFFDELIELVDGYPKQPDDGWAVALARDQTSLRPIFEAQAERFMREVKGWRSVDPTDRCVRVRGSFVRFLALGGDDQAPVHAEGVWLMGALIDDTIDLESTESVRSLSLFNCVLGDRLNLRNATLDRLILNGSHVKAIGADSSRFAGNLFLRDGFLCDGEVRLLNADVGGNFDCSGGTLRNPSGHALSMDGMQVTGHVFMRHGFRADGEVRMPSARISGNLECSGGAFHSPRRARSIANPEGQALAERALHLQSAKIDGALVLRDSFIRGSVNMSGAHCGALVDDENVWQHTLITAPGGDLVCARALDGLTYDRFVGDTILGPAQRIAWIEQQPRAHLTTSFRPQPFEQLAKVYRATGHEAWAREILKEKQRRQHWSEILALKAKPVWPDGTPRVEDPAEWTLRWAKVVLSRVWLFILQRLLGFGYGKKRLALLLALLFLGCAQIYQQAERQGLFAPKALSIVASTASGKHSGSVPPECRARWTTCPPPTLPREHPRFSPHLYSADLTFPLVSFGQRDAWIPLAGDREWQVLGGQFLNVPATEMTLYLPLGLEFHAPWWFLRFVTWAEVVLGWGLSFLLVAVLGGLIKKE